MVSAPRFSTVSVDPTVWGYHGRLGDLLFRFASSEREPLEFRRQFSQRQTINTEANPEDFSDDLGRTYSQVQWYGGENTQYAQRPENRGAPATSFYRSEGLRIDDDAEENELVIVNQMEEVVAGGSPSPVSRADYDDANETLYYTNGTTSVQTITDLNNASPTTGSEATGASNALEDVVVLGGIPYVATGTQILDDDGGWAQWSDVNAVRLWRAKNRIWASDGRRLYVDPIGSGVSTGDAIIELPADEEWVDLVDEGEYVVCVASDGEVYFVTLNLDDGTPSVAGEAELHREKIVAVGALYGAVILLTYQQDRVDTTQQYTYRLWRGEIAGETAAFSSLQVLREWTTNSLGEVFRTIDESERESLYFSIDDGTNTSLWRYNLSRDYLMSDKIMDGLTGSYATFIGKVLGRFWVVTESGAVWREDPSTQRTEGVLVGPAVDFFSADDKVWARLNTSGCICADNAEIIASVTSDPENMSSLNEEADWTRVGVQATSEDQSFNLVLGESRYLSVRLQARNGAKIKGYALRSLPPLSDDEILLRINASDDVFRPGKKRQQVRGLGEAIWSLIRSEQGQAVDLNLYDLDKIWRGSLIEVSTPVTTYRPDGSLTKVVEVIFRGEEITGTSSDDDTWGGVQWGVGLWGKDEI